jgi:hypothetical protein
VPASPEAPHIVDGVYYGRGERTRKRLSDPEVVRLHERRRGSAPLLSAALEDEVTRDHLGPEQRRNGHLWVAAVPLTAQHELAVPLLASEAPRAPPGGHSPRRQPRSPPLPRPCPPVGYLSVSRRVVGGRAVSSYVAAGPGRSMHVGAGGADGEQNLGDLTVREDGQVRLTMGRATALRQDRLLVLDGLVYAWVIRVAGMTGFVATETGYRGSWGFAVRVDRLRGAVSSTLTANDVFGEGAPIYDATHGPRLRPRRRFRWSRRPGRSRTGCSVACCAPSVPSRACRRAELRSVIEEQPDGSRSPGQQDAGPSKVGVVPTCSAGRGG